MKKRLFSLFTTLIMICSFVGVMPNIEMKVEAATGVLFPLKGDIVTSSSVRTNGYYCDYKAVSGTPVYAPCDGTVAFRQTYAVNYSKLASYANNFEFKSTDGVYRIIGAHLSSFNGVGLKYTSSLSYPCSASKYSCKTITLETKNVKQGDLIGYTGMTGNASGPHLHLEVYKNGGAVNPKTVLDSWNGAIPDRKPINTPIDSSYKTPISNVTPKNTSGLTLVYNMYGEPYNTSVRNIAPGDVCTVHEVYQTGFCKVTYPTPNGDHTEYAKASDFNIPKETILDYGDSFSGLILNKRCWKPIMVGNDEKIVLGTENQTNMRREIWRFTKNSDGSYRIVSYYNGKSLDVYNSDDKDYTTISTYDNHDGNNQKWFIVQADYGIMLRPASSSTRVMDMHDNSTSDGTPIQLYQKNNTDAQKFDIWKFKDPGASKLTVTAGTSYTNTKFSWTKSSDTDKYTVKIWKNKAWEGSSYKEYSTTGTSWNVTLPEGTYQAYVDSSNNYSYTCSNVVTFTVKKGTCTHSYGSWTTSKAATCTAEGTKTRKCSICGATETGTIAKIAHKYTSKVIAPTCTAKGYTQYTCSCGDTYTDTETAAKGHKFTSETENGNTTYTCSTCKFSYKVTFEGKGTTESPYLIVNKEDLYCLAGLMNNIQTADFFRTKCYKQTADIDLKNEKWTPMGKFKINGKDTVCYFEKGFVYDGNNHSIFNMNVNETSGYTGFIGKVNFGTVKNLAVYGNVSSTTETGEGTAGIVGEVGYMGKVLNCSFNGNVSSDESSGGIVGHVWRGATIDNCYHNGTVTGGKWAGGIVGLALDKNYESEIHTNIKNCYHVGKVTGPEAGGILGRHSETGTLNENNTLNITNSYFLNSSAEKGLGAGTITKNESTALDSDSLKSLAKKLGGTYRDNSHPKLNDGYPVFEWQFESTGHKYTSKVVNPSCTAKGYTEYVCSACKHTYKDKYTEMTAHKYGDWTVAKKATCTEDGIKTRKCACGKTETATIAKIGHTYTSKVVAPTCTAKGYTLHTCSACDNSYKDAETAATGHKWGKWTIVKSPTCNVDGINERECQNCNEIQSQEVSGGTHNYEKSIVNPTCKSDGYTIYTCVNCQHSYNDDIIKSHGHEYETETFEPGNGRDPYTLYTCKYCSGSFKDKVSKRHKGDINNDGKVLISDVVFINNYFMKKAVFNEEQAQYADVNEDGTLNVFDMIMLKRSVINGN